MADQMVQFVSTTELNAKKDELRKAREQILGKAKADYERAERRRAKRKETGEDTWMLPGLSDRIAGSDDSEHHKKKKKKKEKHKENKIKKDKKKSKKEKEASTDSDSPDEWVEKGAGDNNKSDANAKKGASTQRESWMMFPCFSASSKTSKQEEEVEAMDVEEEEKKLSSIDMTGQHPRELNPYWKDGGEGIPSAHQVEPSVSQGNIATPTDAATSYDANWLKKSLQRSQEQAEEEGRSLEDVVGERWGSLERLEMLIAEAEKRCGGSSNRRDREKGRSGSRNNDYRDRSRGENMDRKGNNSHERERYYERRKENVRGIDRDQDTDKSRDEYSRRDRDHDYRRGDRRDKHVDRHDKWHHRSDLDKRPGRTDRDIFKRPDTSDASSSSDKFIRPTEEANKSSPNWEFDSNTKNTERTVPPSSKSGQSSGGWRKKSAANESSLKVNRIEQALKNRKHKTAKDVRGSSSSESSESDNEEPISEESKDTSKTQPEKTDEPVEPVESTERAVPQKKITEADLNSMGAKILRAELMDDEDLASELKTTLEQMRKDKKCQETSESSKPFGREKREEEVVILTKTDQFGNTRPVNISETRKPQHGRNKNKKVTTHDKSGDRERYFADDDRYDLKEMVRREKMNTAEDYNSMFSRLASKSVSKTDSEDFTIDDHFVSGAATKYSKAKEEERERMRAIKEHHRLSEQLSKCRFCFENPDLSKHLIIAIGLQVYLALPLHTSLTEGHCLIIPMQHQVAFTFLDENVVDEIKVFKKGLTRMFQEMDKDVVFLETCRNLTRQNHMIIECVPVPKEDGDLAPMYFKKAIQESESEWAHNKKLIDTSQKGLRGSIPRGLPYFSVEFGLDGGFAHVVEEENLFPHFFGKEVIGGMLDIEPWTWHKPHRENFEQHKKKVLQFADWWKPYDWTKRLEKNR